MNERKIFNLVIVTVTAFTLLVAPIAQAAVPAPTRDWNATDDVTLNGIWEASAGNLDWNLQNMDGTNLIPLVSSGFDNSIVTQAYTFNGVDEHGTTNTLSPGNTNASFEILFKPSDYIDTGNEILVETGGNGDGTAMYIKGSTLRLWAKDGGANAQAEFDLSTISAAPDDFFHIVGVINLGDDKVDLYVNGEFKTSASGAINDWAGTDGAGLGFASGTTPTTNARYGGEIALLRLYDNALLGAPDVTELYESIAIIGTDFTWTDGAAADTTWDNVDNWDVGGAIPGVDDSAILDTTLAITLDSDAVARTLNVSLGSVDVTSPHTMTIGTTAAIDTGANLTVNGTFNAAELSVDATSTLTINGAIDVGAIAVETGSGVTFGNAGQLTVGSPGGTLGAVITNGNTTVNTAGPVTLNSFNDNATIGTFTKSGAGTMTLPTNNTGDGSIVAANTTFQVSAGTLIATGTDRLGGSTELVLNGGTFETSGTIVDTYTDGLDHHGFNAKNNGFYLNLNNNGGMMGSGDPTSVAAYHGSAILLNGPGNRGLDFNNDADWTGTGAVGVNDNYSNLIVGYLTVPVGMGGDWTLKNVQDDDESGIWFDIDNDGVFESDGGLGSNRNEQLQWNNDRNAKTLSGLVEGESYLVAFTHAEGAGGSGLQINFSSPTLGDRIIKPGDAAQAGIWQTRERDILAIDMSATNVTVTNNSNVVVTTDHTVTFGSLSLNNGIVNVTGAPGGTIFSGNTTVAAGAVTGITSPDALTLGTLTVGEAADVTVGGSTANATSLTILDDGDNSTSATIRATGVFDAGTYDDGANAVALTQAGSGTVKLLGLGATAADGTAFTVQNGGTIQFSGATPIGGSTSALNLAGGTISITGDGSPAPAGAAAYWSFDETTGLTATDSAGGHNGTLDGFAGDNSQWVAGQVGGALRINGDSDSEVVNAVGYKGISGAQARTTAAWVKTTDIDGTILSWGTNTGSQKWVFRTQSGNGPNGAIRTEVNGGYNVGTTSVSDGDWHHVAMVLPDGATNVNQMLIYIDGLLEASSNTQAKAIATAVGADLQIGLGFGAQPFTGLLDELYIYDSALDATQIASLAAGGVIDPISMTSTNLVVTADSGLEAITNSTADFGALSFDGQGILTTSGAGESISFTGTTVTSATGDIGFETLSDTYAGPIDFNSTSLSLIKTGGADLVLDTASLNAAGAAFDVRAGRLIAETPDALVTDNTIGINGGEVVLTATDPVTGVTYDNPVASTGGTLTAGANGGLNIGALTLNVGNATGNDVTLTSGTLTLQTTDDYTMNIAGNVAGAGNMAVGAGSTVTVAGTVSAGAVTIDGSLAVGGAVNVNQLIANTGGTYAGTSDLTVTQTLTLNGDLDLSASTLVVDGADVTVNGGTLTVGAGNNLGAGTALNSLDVSNAGGLTLNGSTVATNKLATPGGTFDMGGTGSLIASGNVVADPASGPGQLELTGGTVTLEAAVGGVTPEYRYYRMSNIATRGGADNPQLSELDFWAGGAEIPTPNADVNSSDSSGKGPTANEGPSFAFDGNTATKWYSPATWLKYDFLTPTEIEEYTFATANDVANRDPVRWMLEGSNNDADWFVIDDQTGADYATPTARFTYLPANIVVSVPGPTTMNLPGTNLRMTTATTLDVAADTVLGTLSVANVSSPVTLTFTGDSERTLNLAGTTFDAALTGSPGLIVDTTPIVNLGELDLEGSVDPVIRKIGAGELIITDAAIDYTGTATVNVNDGTLTLGDSGLLGASTINVNSATRLKLSSSVGDTAYTAETINPTGDVTFLAGPADANASAAAVITLPTINDLSGRSLTLGADENYTLKITNPVAAATMTISGAGAVTLDNGGAATAALNVPTGTLNVNNAAIVTPSISVTGTGSLNLDVAQSTNDLLVNTSGVVSVPNLLTATNITLGDVEITDNVNLQITGSNLADPTGTITVSGGAFTVSSGTTYADVPAGFDVHYGFEDAGALGKDTAGGNVNLAPAGNAVAQGPGVWGSALDLTGQSGDDGLKAGNNFFANDIAEISYSFWLDPDSLVDGSTLFKEGGATNGVEITIDADGLLDFHCRDNNSGQTLTSTTDIGAAAGFTHVVAIYDDDAMSLYINGVLEDSLADAGFAGPGVENTITSHSNTAGVGLHNGVVSSGNRGFDGLIDEFYIYETALSQAQIDGLYNPSISYGPVDMPNLALDLATAGPSTTITLNGDTVALGSLTMGANTDLTIVGTEIISLNDITVNAGATTINNGGLAIATTVRGTVATTGGVDLTSDLSINGDLTMASGSAMNAVGAAVIAKSYTNNGGTVAFDDASSLTLTASALTQTAGSTLFAPAATLTGVTAIDVTGGSLTTPAVTATDLQVSNGQLNLAADMSVATATLSGGAVDASAAALVVSDTVTLDGGITLVKTAGTDFQMTGGDLLAPSAGNHREVMLNGSTVVITTPTTGLFQASKINTGLDPIAPDVIWSETAGEHTILGSGADIWGGNDGMTFVYQEFDASEDIDISAHVNPNGDMSAVIGNLNAWTKAGLMIRQSLDTNSRNVIELVASTDTNGVNTQIRKTDGAASAGSGANPATNTSARIAHGDDVWVRLTYDATTKLYKTYYSDDPTGTGWIEHSGVAPTDPAFMKMDAGQDMTGTILVGMAVTSHNVATLAQAQFSDLDGFITPVSALNMPFTELNANATSTVSIPLEQAYLGPITLGGMTTAAGATLTIDSPATTIGLTNLAMEGSSMIRSTYAADTGNVAVIADAVELSGGMNYLGDASQLGGDGDSNSTNLTLSDGAVIDWTFDGLGSEPFDGGLGFLDVKGNITLDGTLTVNVLDGIGTATDKDIFIMMARGTITGNVGDVTIDKPAGWEWDSFAIEQRSPSTWALVLKNATFGVTEQNAGDTNNDGFVDDVDLANFELAFGLSGAGLIAEGFAFDPDFDNDGDADLDDFVTLRQFFGTDYNNPPAMPDLSQTPEPATMSLLALGALAILRRRRRRS
jgi:hypothetical protein